MNHRLKLSVSSVLFFLPGQVLAHGLPSQAVLFYGVIYLIPFFIGAALARKQLCFYLAICLVTFDLSWRLLPLGFVLPWLTVPIAGAISYRSHDTRIIDKKSLRIYLILSVVLGVALAVWFCGHAPIDNGIYTSTNNSLFPSLEVLPVSTSAFASGNANYYNKNGYFIGALIQFILLVFYFCVSIEKLLSIKFFERIKSGDEK
jgi:hypothetical protein